jgi:GNAT superfamily N-acetyltransferase
VSYFRERMLLTCRYLEILAIHPDHQGRRVGTQLLDHHLAQIDDPSSSVAAAPAWLESSPAGFRLYKSRHFESVGDIIAEGWEGGFPGMFRPAPRV